MDRFQLADMHVLIVEDNLLIAQQIVDFIEDAGATTCLATDIGEANLLLDTSEQLPDAALLDLRLDDLSFGIAEQLRQLNIPFAFVTGNPEGVPGHLSDRPICAKPFTSSSLLAALVSALLPADNPPEMRVIPQAHPQPPKVT